MTVPSSPASPAIGSPPGGPGLVADLRRRHERRRRLFPRALLVGVLAGLVASFFRVLLERAEDGRAAALALLRPFGAGGLLAWTATAAGGVALAVWLVRRFEPAAAGSGIPQLKATLSHLRPMPGLRLVLVKFWGGLSAIGAGLALGREGPTLQMGGALGGVVARQMDSSSHERQVLIAAGAGAGLAAAFNAPLAGLIFVLEEIQGNFAPGIFSATFIASVTADAVSRYLFGQSAVFEVGRVAPPPLGALPLFGLLGVAAGLLGVAFNRGLRATVELADRVPGRFRVAAGAAVGAAVAWAAWLSPTLVGGGGGLIREALAGRGVVFSLALTLALRFAMTLASYATGTPGGIFAPLLALGSQAGLLGALAAGELPFGQAEPAAWAVTGMAALFAATVRAPLTGIVLMVEMTQGYSLILPLLAASFVAQGVADAWRERPIYDALLERELARGGEPRDPEGPVLLELHVLPGAIFAGRRMAELGLPQGLLVVGIERQGAGLVPTAETRLIVADRLTVAVAPQAAAQIGALRRGLGLDGEHLS